MNTMKVMKGGCKLQNLIIDTDIGGDIDDAIAIAMTLCSPKMNLLGVSTVFTYVHERARLASKLMEVYGYNNIPVAVGSEKPLIGRWDETLYPDQCKILKEDTILKFNTFGADFIVDKVLKNNDVVIAAIGPLTNIALALAKAPEVSKKAKLVMMGGMITKAYPEWNIACDPEAARIVFESGIPITMAGLDVTLKCRLCSEDIERIRKAKNPQNKFLYELIKIYTERYNLMPILHDPLALSTLIWPEIFKFEDKEIRVETRGEFTRGVTVDYEGTGYNYEKKVNARVCVDVDEKKFIYLVLQRLTQTI